MLIHTLLAVLSLAGPLPGDPADAKSAARSPFFALCMDTHDAKKRSLKEQAVLLKDLGYDGAGHLWLEGLAERLATLDAAGLKLFQVYFRVDLNAAEPFDPKLKDALPLLKDRGAQLAILITGGKPSDEARDPQAMDILRRIADLAKPQGVKLALYPHVGDWLERVEDAVRLADKTDRPEVGVMFNLCHWLKVGQEKDLERLLTLAMPRLLTVSINGSDRGADIRSGKGGWILPLDQGSYDVGLLLKMLHTAGFRGPIGLQCYGIPGDARDHLTKSMEAWRRMRKAAVGGR